MPQEKHKLTHRYAKNESMNKNEDLHQQTNIRQHIFSQIESQIENSSWINICKIKSHKFLQVSQFWICMDVQKWIWMEFINSTKYAKFYEFKNWITNQPDRFRHVSTFGWTKPPQAKKMLNSSVNGKGLFMVCCTIWQFIWCSMTFFSLGEGRELYTSGFNPYTWWAHLAPSEN